MTQSICNNKNKNKINITIIILFIFSIKIIINNSDPNFINRYNWKESVKLLLPIAIHVSKFSMAVYIFEFDATKSCDFKFMLKMLPCSKFNYGNRKPKYTFYYSSLQILFKFFFINELMKNGSIDITRVPNRTLLCIGVNYR